MPEMSPPTGPVTIKTVLLANFAFLLIFACGAHGQFTILNQPPISNRPYPSAYYNQKLPNAGAGGPLNHLMPNSSNIVNTVMKNGGGNLVTGSGAWNTPGKTMVNINQFILESPPTPFFSYPAVPVLCLR